MSEQEKEFIDELNRRCNEKGTKTNFADLNHLIKYIIGAEMFLKPWRD